MTVRGQFLEVEIDSDSRIARYSLKEGDGVKILHEDEEIQLTKEDPIATRSIVDGS